MGYSKSQRVKFRYQAVFSHPSGGIDFISILIN